MRSCFVFAMMLGLLHFIVPALKAQTEGSKVVFQKELPDKRKLLVLWKEVPDVPPPPVYEGNGKSRVLLTRIKPDRVSEFSLFLVSNQSISRRLLWKKTIPEYIRYEPEAKFFDVFFDKGTFVVVYNAGNMYEAEVSTSRLPYEKKDLDFSRIFYHKKRQEHPSVASATVQLWGKDKALSLAVRFSNKATARYLWTPNAKAGESKWVMISKPPSLDLPVAETPDPEPLTPPKRKRQADAPE